MPWLGPPLLFFTGTVRDASGKPMEGVQLETCPVILGTNQNPTAQTDAEGRYTLALQRDTLSSTRRYASPMLIARHADRNLAAFSFLAENATNLDFILQPSLEIVGRVENASGRPIPNARMRLWLVSSNRTARAGFAREFPADADGRFRISTLPAPQGYALAAFATDHGVASREVLRDQSITNFLELKTFVLKVADRVLAGQVTGPDGQTVAEAVVTLYGEGQTTAPVQTDAAGRFHFAKVCEGQVNLSANYKSQWAFTNTTAGDTNVVLQLDRR